MVQHRGSPCLTVRGPSTRVASGHSKAPGTWAGGLAHFLARSVSAEMTAPRFIAPTLADDEVEARPPSIHACGSPRDDVRTRRD
jgi:hypothetical protein